MHYWKLITLFTGFIVQLIKVIWSEIDISCYVSFYLEYYYDSCFIEFTYGRFSIIYHLSWTGVYNQNLFQIILYGELLFSYS